MGFNITTLLISIPGIVVALTVHEFAHGYSAFLLGDDTAKKAGRLTLNPLSHIDPWGFVALMIAGFGWAKPVPVNPSKFKNTVRDDIIVSLAGISANVALAFLFSGILKFEMVYAPEFLQSTLWGQWLSVFLSYSIWINLILCFFNLIPLPPLDGSHVLMHMLPKGSESLKYKLMMNGPKILMAIILVGIFTHVNIFAPITFLSKTVQEFFFLVWGIA